MSVMKQLAMPWVATFIFGIAIFVVGMWLKHKGY